MQSDLKKSVFLLLFLLPKCNAQPHFLSFLSPA